MNQIRVKPKDAANIITSLEAGVVPKRGVQQLMVGRNKEVVEVINVLERIYQGESDVKFWVGDFGSGKSFMLQMIQSIATQRNFVSSTIDLTPTRRLQASDGKGRALYREIIDQLTIKTSQEGNALRTILDEWLEKVMFEVAEDSRISSSDVQAGAEQKKVENKILNTVNNFKSSGLSYEIGLAIIAYYKGMIQNNLYLQQDALRWIQGDYPNKTAAKKGVGIETFISDDNWFEAVKTLSELFLDIGYSGFIINLDEMVNLYQLSHAVSRDRNYERVLNIYNECKSGRARGLMFNFGVTRKALFDEYKGMASYGALKTRLGDERSLDSKLVNTNKTVLPLKPLTNEEIFTLLENLVSVYNTYHKSEIQLSQNEITQYMEIQLNRPGAAEFLTPRAVIKDFLEILDLIRQNSTVAISEIIKDKFGDNLAPVLKDILDTEDEVEIL